jgi:16S rRNA (cytosine1402-N4)-methyltransferase
MPIHIPVLPEEVLISFGSISKDKKSFFLDCTAGEGGHSKLILENFPKAKILLNDRDYVMLEKAKERVNEFSDRVFFREGIFSEITESTLEEFEIEKFDAILIDFGISTFHLKESERGFSFKKDEFLDMRLSHGQKLTAFEVVNEYSSRKLTQIFREYGEENWTLKIVDKLIESRRKKKLETTFELAKLVECVIPRKFWQAKTHPSFRIFQAIRIEVNNELEHIKKALVNLPKLLNNNGILSVISFHSLEDRIAKNSFKELERTDKFEIITKKPIYPSSEEVEKNFASRSARLRILKAL